MDFFFRTVKYLNYSLSAGNAHAIHSPFVFDLFTNVIEDTAPYYAFEKVEALRSQMLLSRKKIIVDDYGTGMLNGSRRELSLKYIAGKYVNQKKYGQLLFRLVNRFQPKTILEIGTSIGITTLYLALPCTTSRVITLEGSTETAAIAVDNFKKAGAENIELIIGEFSATLPIAIEKAEILDFVYFDGNHRKNPTLDYFEKCLLKRNENSVFVFDDIYHSREMSEAWNAIKDNDAVTKSIDLFSIGIVFFRTGQPKQHFILRY
jgi:predicted O-methyltransferase YrrM